MTEQGSNFEEKEKTEMMNVQEVARMTEWLRAKGMSDTERSEERRVGKEC